MASFERSERFLSTILRRARGAQFLRQARDVLARADAILWVTPEGRFTDARERPVTWKPGVAALTRQLDECTVVPLAIEYTFWNQRLPEVLCSVGEPLWFAAAEQESNEARTERLQMAIMTAQDELAQRSMQRDASLFTPVFAGGAGVSATYDAWRRLKSAVSGQPYIAGA